MSMPKSDTHHDALPILAVLPVFPFFVVPRWNPVRLIARSNSVAFLLQPLLSVAPEHFERIESAV